MNLIFENPYRIIGLLVGATAREQERQVRRLKQYIEAEQAPEEDFSLPKLGALHRTLETVSYAATKLSLDNDKMLAALFWFYKGNAITDEAAFDALKEADFPQAATIWEKMVAHGEVSPKNASAYSNLSTLYLSGALDGANANIEKGISLKIKFLESDFFRDFKALATDETYKTNKKDLQLLFLNQLQAEIETHKNITTKLFLELLNKQNFSAKEDFFAGFVQKPIEQIEQKIELSASKRKESKANSHEAGKVLIAETSGNLAQLAAILGTENPKYTTIADKTAKELLTCGIEHFKHYKDSERDPGRASLDLLKKAATLASKESVKQTCQEHINHVQAWIAEEPLREREQKVKAEAADLSRILDKMALNTDSIKNATNLIQQTKPVLAKIAAALGKSDATYLKLSAKVADAAQHNIIEEVNAAQEDAQHAQQKIEAVNRKFGRNMNDVSAFMAQQLVIEKYKTLLEEAWTATNLLATLDMPQEFKDLRYLPNRQSLKELCAQLGVSTYIASPISTSPTTVKPTISSPTKNEDTPVLLKWVVGIVFFLGLVFAIWGKEGFGVLFAICAFTVVVIRPFIKNPGCGVMIICTGLGAFMGGIYAIPGGALGIGFLGFVIGGIIAMKFFEGKY